MSSVAPSSSRDLVDRLRRGDVAAFDEVYEGFQPRLFSFLLRLANRRDVAEDLSQQTWLNFARMAPRLEPDTAIAPLLFTIARNAFLSYRRWAMLDLSRIVTLGLEALSASAPYAPSPEIVHEKARAMDTLEQALGGLPVASREVLLLVGVEGMEQEEVARMLGISYAALRQRLNRARSLLAERVEEFERTPGAGRRARSINSGEEREGCINPGEGREG